METRTWPASTHLSDMFRQVPEYIYHLPTPEEE